MNSTKGSLSSVYPRLVGDYDLKSLRKLQSYSKVSDLNGCTSKP